jgi:hypothetical protein
MVAKTIANASVRQLRWKRSFGPLSRQHYERKCVLHLESNVDVTWSFMDACNYVSAAMWKIKLRICKEGQQDKISEKDQSRLLYADLTA